MKGLLQKIIALIVSVTIITVVLGACTKEKDTSMQKSVSITKTATPIKTTKKTITKTSGTVSGTIVKTSEIQVSPGKDDKDDTDNSTPDDTVEGEKPTIDLEGRTLQISWTDDKDSIPVFATIKMRIAEAEKLFNFKAEYNLRDIKEVNLFRDTIIQNHIAGLRVTDIISMSTYTHYMPFMLNNVILPLDDILDFENPLIKNYEFLYNLKWRGKHYVLTSNPDMALGSWSLPYNIGNLQYNSTLFANEGQPDILDLVEANKWNWDTFLDICINVTRDLDGDGIIDQWAITSDTSTYFTQMMLYSNGAIPVVQEGDRYILGIYDIKARKAMQFVSDLAFIHQVTTFPSSKVAQERYCNGLVAMFINVAGYNTRHLNGVIGAPLKTSMVAPLPLGPDVTERICVVNPTLYGALATTPYEKEIGEIMKYIYISWDENLNTYSYLMDTIKGKPKLWEPGSLPLPVITTEREYNINFNVKDMAKYIDFYIVSNYDFYNNWNKLVITPIMQGKMSVSQALDSSRGTLESIINKYLGQ